MTIDTSTDAVERLLEDVTPGPWITVKSDVYPEGECDSWVTIGREDFDAVALIVNEHIKDDPELKANARFIRAARDLVPALLKERDEARALVAAAFEAAKVPRIIPFHTAAKFGVCIGGRWDGWIMIQHPDGYWVSHHKPEPVDLSIATLRAIGDGEA